MARNFDTKADDDAGSSASFEDVGTRGDESLVVFKEGVAPPEVLYTLKFESPSGIILQTRHSDKPFEASAQITPDDEDPKTSVIEIVTSVRSTSPQPYYPGDFGRMPPPPPPPAHIRPRYRQPPDYYSDEDEYVDRRRQAGVTRAEDTSMIIHSAHLKAALNAVVGYYPGSDFISETVSIRAPYWVLVQHMKELELYKVNQPPSHDEEYASTTAKHIDILLSFLKGYFGEKLQAETKRWNAATPAATFELLWLLLNPGEIIYSQEDGHWTPFVISRVRLENGFDSGRRRMYTINCWNLEFIDDKIERQMYSVRVHHFSGEQAIQSLSAIPARFYTDNPRENAEKQVHIGRQYWELSKRPVYQEYNGELVDRDENNGGKLAGRVIVDCEGYARFRDDTPMARPRGQIHIRRGGRRGCHSPERERIPPKDYLPHLKPRCICAACVKAGVTEEAGPFAGFDDLKPSEDKMPDSDIYMHVLTDAIPAFMLSERRWGFVLVENLKEVKPDREAFKYLVLDDEVKLTVKALIGKFANADGKVSPWPSDFVRNKGEGRIFLLHGSPGVGKTCTAECVAELTSRPLLALTSGDISTSMASSSVERHLSYFLQLGERYGALVLLDEADVYLEERRTRDLARNGLVSVFLRALEYYRGVLFLTTNRVAAFDPAFTSRIHVALHYKRLRDADRQRIWTHNFARLERDSAAKCHVPLAAREYCLESADVKALRWNGREIRNALQTAVALAETEALEDGVEQVTVAEKHLRAVVRMSKGFKDYMRRNRVAWGDDCDEDDEDEDGEGYNASDESDYSD